MNTEEVKKYCLGKHGAYETQPFGNVPTFGYELRDATEIGVIDWFCELENEKLNNSRYLEL